MFPIFNHPNKSRYLSANTFLTRPRRRSASPLLRDLVAHWSLDEASGTRHDALGAHHLTPHGDLAQIQGKLGYAAQFDPGTSDYLSVVSHSGLQPGAGDFTLAGWAMFDFVGAAGLVGKWESGVREYLLASDGVALSFSASADGEATATVTHSGSLETGLWCHFVAWHDAVNETLNLLVNNLAPASVPHTGGIFAGSADLNLGRDALAGAFLSGRLDSISLWKRLLTADERNQLYNNGEGLAYPF